MTIGVWTPFVAAGPLGDPGELPLGRAAMALAERGTVVVIGRPVSERAFDGVVVDDGAWREVREVCVDAVYDRFPSASRAEAFEAGRRLLEGVPIANPPWFTECCRDKLDSQRRLESGGLVMPPVSADLTAFDALLDQWGAAFLKPRYGSFGRGVCRVEPGAVLPTEGAWVLQRAISPPGGAGGVSIRVLVQRDQTGTFLARTPVVRRSSTDPVVNAARGADLSPLAEPSVVQALAVAAITTLAQADPWVLEAGVDAVVDADGQPHLIEINSRPRGRLRALAAQDPRRFMGEHVQACVRPLEILAT